MFHCIPNSELCKDSLIYSFLYLLIVKANTFTYIHMHVKVIAKFNQILSCCIVFCLLVGWVWFFETDSHYIALLGLDHVM